jgi:DNA ligase-associated metallophosphoesterase
MQELKVQGAYIYDWRGFSIYLLPEKAIYLPDYQAMLIADPHFGKAAHFRKAGIPVPEKVHANDYHKILNLIQDYQVKQLFFLGDLFHSDLNSSWSELELFISQFPEIQFHLIKGNHDILGNTIYHSGLWQIHEESFNLGPLTLSHEPLVSIPPGSLNLCGHIHPGISLYGAGRQSIKLPCFFVTANLIIMPAFGKFTGLAKMHCKKNERAFVITDKKVIPVNLTA